MLGPLEVLAGGRPVALGGAKARALLAFLLLKRGGAVAPDRLVDELWGERPPKAVAAELRVYVAKLRKALGAAAVVTRPDGYALMADADAVDAWRFEREARRGSALLAAGDAPTAARVLAEALALWRGAALGELADEPWAQGEARRLEESRVTALEEQVEAELALGRHVALVPDLERLIVQEPFRERPRAQLMLALYRCGRQVEALELYRQTVRLFVRELGIEPGQELRERERAILRHDPSLTPESARGSLPAPPTPLIGRRRELDELVMLVGQPHVRLVTLTGPGGSGKTRLALEVAARLERELGVPAFFIELAPLADPTLVLATVAHALGAESVGGLSVLETLRAFVRDRPLLLVLDNFEHLLPAAGQVAELLATAPSLTIVTTSRISLHIRAEHGYDVEPLRIEDAVRLFIERVRTVRRDFDPPAAVEDVCREICERLDCLPLAIELAAARARRVDPALVLSGLSHLVELGGGFRDIDERQQTLRRTIDWSYRLLDSEQRRLLARLSVFRGTFTLEAAQAVCAADRDRVAALVDASVVARRGERYVMLETIREFAEAKAAAAERQSVRRRHAEFFLGVARRAAKELAGPEAAAALERLEHDLGNFRHAFDWWLRSTSPEELLTLVNALHRLFAVTARAREGLNWAVRALERAEALPARPWFRARVLIKAAAFSERLGNVAEARRFYEEALRVARDNADVEVEAGALTGIATIARDSGVRMIPLQEHAVELARSVSLRANLGIGLDNLGVLHLIAGDLEAAAAALDAAMDVHRDRGDAINECVTLNNVANVALHRGQVDAAVASFRGIVARGHQLRSPWLAGAGVEGLAAALQARGADVVGVVRLLGASEALFAAAGLGDRYRNGYLPTVCRADGQTRLKSIVEAQAHEVLDSAAYDRAWGEGRALASDAAVQLALSVSEDALETGSSQAPQLPRTPAEDAKFTPLAIASFE